MPLSPEELAASRAFREAEVHAFQMLHAVRSPQLTPLPYVHHCRHPCTAAGGRSRSFEFREVYHPSPAYLVLIRAADTVVYENQVAREPQDGEVPVPAGRFGFIYREGSCGPCGLTALSRAWRLVDSSLRPPAHRART